MTRNLIKRLVDVSGIVCHLVFCFLFLFMFSCGEKGGDNEKSPESDDDFLGDDTLDDDSTDDDASTSEPPILSNPRVFPDIPVGPDNAIIFYQNICDVDGDLTEPFFSQIFFADTGDSYTDSIEISPFDDPPTDCDDPPSFYMAIHDISLETIGLNEFFSIAWDNSGNESLELFGYSFWVQNPDLGGPEITNASLEYDDGTEELTYNFSICDENESLDGGKISYIWYSISDSGHRLPFPWFGGDHYLNWDDFVLGDYSNCSSPFEVEYISHGVDLQTAEYCLDLIVTNGAHQGSNYIQDICFSVP